jgi:hypothetical protein
MNFKSERIYAVGITLATFASVIALSIPAAGQNTDMLQKLQEIKAAAAANKQALAHYTWQETQTISLKGEVKKTTVFQVSVGPDGTQQKTELGGSPTAAPSGRRLKQHIIAKKKEEYQEYGEQMAALAKQYTPPQPELLQQAYKAGNISAKLDGAPGMVSLIIKSYLKPNDSMTLVFNRQAKELESLQIASYLSDPTDAVNITVTFSKLQTGVNHVATTQVNGVSKQLMVNTQNSNYQTVQQ